MKSTACAAVLLLAGTLAVQAAPDAGNCQYSEHPVTASQPAKTTTLEVRASSPAEGGDVRKETVIGIDLEYHVAKFVPDSLILTALFPTDEGSSTGPGDSTNTPPLTSADGTVHLCVPLTSIYDNDRVRWPLSLFVIMIEMQGRRGQGVGTSRTLKFNGLDPPPGALAPRVDGPAEKFADSVKGAWDYLALRTARYKGCIARFAQMQPPLTRAYRAWESRHRADMDLIAEAKFEMDKARSKGRADMAAATEDSFMDAQIDGLQQMPVELARSQCEGTLEELKDPDDQTDGAIGEYIEFVKKYRAKNPPGEAK
jgi:hypothetical protein